MPCIKPWCRGSIARPAVVPDALSQSRDPAGREDIGCHPSRRSYDNVLRLVDAVFDGACVSWDSAFDPSRIRNYVRSTLIQREGGGAPMRNLEPPDLVDQ